MGDWQTDLQAATAALERNSPEEAEGLLRSAITNVQETCGAHHANAAECFMKLGQCLELLGRHEEAALPYKLAASIYKQTGRAGLAQLAHANWMRLSFAASGESGTFRAMQPSKHEFVCKHCGVGYSAHEQNRDCNRERS